FVDARGLCAGRVGCRNDLIDHGDDRVIRMSVERTQRVPRNGLGLAIKRKKLGSQRGEKGSRSEDAKSFTPMHSASQIWITIRTGIQASIPLCFAGSERSKWQAHALRAVPSLGRRAA